MPSGNEVRPQKWTNVIDVYDDGEYSAIWGNYNASPKRHIGVRWNGGNDKLGYPALGANPVWYVEPDFLTKSALFGFLARIKEDNSRGNIDNILTALKEC